jgi:cytochrome P450
MLMSEIEVSEVLNHELSRDFLLAEGVGGAFAGTDTTSTMLNMTFRELCLNSDMYDQLHEELKEAFPSLEQSPTLNELEALPYLSAYIKV